MAHLINAILVLDDIPDVLNGMRKEHEAKNKMFRKTNVFFSFPSSYARCYYNEGYQTVCLEVYLSKLLWKCFLLYLAYSRLDRLNITYKTITDIFDISIYLTISKDACVMENYSK